MSRAAPGYPRSSNSLVNVPGVGTLVFDTVASDFNQLIEMPTDGSAQTSGLAAAGLFLRDATATSYQVAHGGHADAQTAANFLETVTGVYDTDATDVNRGAAARTAGGTLDPTLIPATAIHGWGGAGSARPIFTNTADNLDDTTQPNALLSAAPGEWSINHAPAANTQATATIAAGGAGVRHVLRSILVVIMSNATLANTVICQVRDGATGAGPLFLTFRLTYATYSTDVSLGDLNIVGSENTALTVEFNSAGGANTFMSVNASGYSTV